MCEAHSQNAPDDIPQSESDVVTPEQKKKRKKTKKENKQKITPETC